MGFSVTIAEGQDRGREYTFNQPEVSIGRVAENDIVLGDAGVSRKHVLIREESGKFIVQDLGSANGTKLNGKSITEDELQDGDEISVGPVVFSFVATPDAGENSTRIFNSAELEQKIKSTREAKVKAASVAAANPKTRQATQMSVAIGSKGPKPKTGTNSPNLPAKAAPAAPSKSTPSAIAKKPPSGSNKVAPASKRLEEKRAAKTLGAKIKLVWSNLPDKVRKGGVIAAVVVGIGVFGVAARRAVVVDEGPGLLSSDESKTVFEVTANPSKECFGLGPGTAHQTSDKAQFSFNFPVTAKKAIATLTFTAGSVAKNEEVDISVGAVHQAFVQRSFGDDQQAQEVQLQPKYLKPNDKNNVVFDNLKNPPGQEPWVVCAIAVKVEQLPDGSVSDLKDQARQEILNADRFYNDRLIDAGNLFAAWKAYKKAGLFLEAMDEKIDEYDVVKQKIRDCRRDLDEQCAKMMLKGAAFEKQNKISDAISQYKYSRRFFPEKDHPCFAQIQARLSDLE